MADWFEERGDEQLATWLRLNGAMVPEGWMLIHAVMKLPYRSRQLVADAVIAEAVGRLESLAVSPKRFILNTMQREVESAVVQQTGRDKCHWRFIKEDGGGRRNDFLFVEYSSVMPSSWQIQEGWHTGEMAMSWRSPYIEPAVQMRHQELVYRLPVELLDGGALAASVDFWFGISGDTVYVTAFRDSHVRLT